MDEVTPVFVCGMGRSGTTNALRILNTHPSVALNSEIPLNVLRHFFALLDSLDRSYGNKDHLSDGWHERKAEYMFDSFGYLSKAGRGRLKKVRSAKFRGHKSPRLESLVDKYEAHFNGLGLMPRYFYCARNPFDCWRSYRAMPWSGYNRAEEFLKDYVESFSRLKQMQNVAAERVFVINLGELIDSPDILAFYREKFFSPLGLDMSDQTVSRIEKIQEERETTDLPDLSREDRNEILSYPGVAELIETRFPRAMSASH